MLILDQFADSVLFQCDRCRFVGELATEIVAEDGVFTCWACLGEINRRDRERQKTAVPAVGKSQDPGISVQAGNSFS